MNQPLSPIDKIPEFQESGLKFPQFTDKINQFSAKVQERVKNVTGLGKIVNDTAGGVGGMIPDILLNAVFPGTMLPAMFMHAAGQATEEALQYGADNATAVTYGIGIGGIEVITEKMFTNPVTGKGFFSEAIEKRLKQTALSPLVQSGMLRLIDLNGEGLEEFSAEIADWMLNKAMLPGYDNRSLSEATEEGAYEYLIGVLMSTVLSIPDMTMETMRNLSPRQRARVITQAADQQAQAQQNQPQTPDTPQNAISATQNALPVQEDTLFLPEQTTRQNAPETVLRDDAAQTAQATGTATQNATTVEQYKAELQRQINEKLKKRWQLGQQLQKAAPSTDQAQIKQQRSQLNAEIKQLREQIDSGETIHTPEQLKVIEEYKAAVDPDILAFVNRVHTLQNPNYKSRVRHTISEVSQRQSADVERLTGEKANWSDNILTGGTISHMLNRHGENGEANQSLKNSEDIARIGYILHNYDTAELPRNSDGTPVLSNVWKNSDGTPAKLVLFSKKIDGTYVSVVAAPDSNAHVLAVETAYMYKGKRINGPVLNMETNSPQVTPETPQRANDLLPENNIAQPTAAVKRPSGVLNAAQTYGQQQAPNRVRQGNQAASALGQAGAEAFRSTYTESVAANLVPQTAIKGFSLAYNAALTGETLSDSDQAAVDRLPADMQTAAIQAGQADAVRAEQARYFGENAGVYTKDGMYKQAHLSTKTFRTLDALGKTLGVEIRFKQSLDGANAQYGDGTITIALDAQDPILAITSHEVVHRIRETAPDVYTALAEFVRDHMSEEQFQFAQNVRQQTYQTDSVNALTEETVADAFGRMVNEKTLAQQLGVENRNVIQKIADVVRDMIRSIQRALHGQNVRLTDAQKQSFSDLQGYLDALHYTFTDAIQETGNRAATRETTNAATVDGDTGNVKFSLSEIDGEKQNYGIGVLLDTNLFDGIKPRNWGKKLSNFVYKHLAGKSITIYDEQGNPETVYFARTDDRVLKDGAKNSHKVIDKLARYRGNNVRALATVQLSELLEASHSDSASTEHSHQWMDENGWNLRTAYIQDRNGTIYQAMLNIARGREKNILYDVNNIRPIDKAKSAVGGSVPSAVSGGASPASHSAFDGTVAQTEESVNPQNAENSKNSRSDRQILDDYIRQYGAIPQGESPRARNVDLPLRTEGGRRLSQTVRTILESGVTPDTMVPDIERLAANGDFSYDTYTDKAAISDAENKIAGNNGVGWEQAQRDWFSAMDAGKVSKELTAMGWALYNNAAASGDTALAIDVLDKMVAHQRNAAQALQATRILKKLSPNAQLYQVQRSVNNLQEEINRRYGQKNAPELKIDPDLATRFMQAATQEARDNALADIYANIGKQLPSSFADRFTAWRYLSMLGNARTHVRNIMGNLGFAPVVMTKDIAATTIESMVYHLSGKRLHRTKAFGRNTASLLRAGFLDYPNIRAQALGEGKYTDAALANATIQDNRRIFNNVSYSNTRSAKWNRTVGKALDATVANAWNHTLGAGLEAARKFNGTALDTEDVWFSRPHYAFALAQYAQANGITAEQIRNGNGIDAARQYAISEAQKATYRDTNQFSELISKLGRDSKWRENPVAKGLSSVVEGVLPFRKTPADILVRGLEYSPLGLLKSITLDAKKVAQGKLSGAEMIDHLSAGLTGTGLVALGVYLAAQGLVRGHGDNDDKKEDLTELQGHQQYALELPDGTSITLDWLAPECLPFFMGVNLWEQATQNDDENLKLEDMLTATGNITEPLLNMSCLQSLNDLFDSISKFKTDDTSALTKVLISGATSYLTQAQPTLFGQLERASETKRYTTYPEADDFLTSNIQYSLGRASARQPGWDFRQIPFIDAWGREELTGEPLNRAFNNLLNPAYLSQISETDMEKELLRLYEATGEGGVLPKRAPKYFNVDSERKNLTGEEYVTYATAKGQTSLKLVGSLLDRKPYKALSDDDKAKVVGDVYEYANKISQTLVGGKISDSDKWITKAQKAEKSGIAPDLYILARLEINQLESTKDFRGNAISGSVSLKIMDYLYRLSGLNDRQRKLLAEDFEVSEEHRDLSAAEIREKLAELPTDATRAAQSKQQAAISSALQSSDMWASATDKQKESIGKAVNAYVKQNETGLGYKEKIDGGADVGLDAEEFFTYLLALKIVDQPTKSGNGVYYTNDEVAAAIRMIPGLTNEERDYLWFAQGRKAKNKPRW